jgi:hypothetical protein
MVVMADKLEISQYRGQRVRLSVPASVAYDFDKMVGLLKNLSEKLGCRPCLSGADCYFHLESDWVVDPAGKLGSIPAAGGITGGV